MKKLLNLIVVVMVSSVSTVNVISCTKNNPIGLTNDQINAASTIAKIGISSQNTTYDLSSNDMLDSLNSKDKTLEANIKSIFANNGTLSDFDNNSKINMQDGPDQIHEANAMLPDITIPQMGSVNIEGIIGILPTIIGMVGSYVLPLLINVISPDFDANIFNEIFSSKLMTKNVLKDTIGSLDKDNNWNINGSQYAGKSYSNVLSESIINFKTSFKIVYDNIIKEKKSIDTISVDDFDNIINGLFVVVNYISQFQMTTTNDFINNEQKLYDKLPNGKVLNVNDHYNEKYKGEILNENYQVLNATNFSTIIENITNSDQTNGLGFQQILFTIFGTAMIKNSNNNYDTLTFNNLPLGQLAEGLLQIIEPAYSENYSLIFLVVGILVTQLSTNQMLNNIIDLLTVAAGVLPINIKNDAQKFINGVKQNPNWYSNENGGNIGGTVWTDLWSGTGSNSLLKLMLNSFNDLLPKSIQNITVDNVDEIYKVLENTKINVPSLNFGGSTQSNEKPKTLLTVKALFQALGKDKIIETLLSPSLFELIEELLDEVNQSSVTTEAKDNYNNFILANNTDTKLTTNADKYTNFVDNVPTTDINALTYIMGEAIAYKVSSQTLNESSAINKDTNNVLLEAWNYTSNNSAFSVFKNALLNSIANADQDIFDTYVNYVFDDLNWSQSNLIHKGNNYSFALNNKSYRYNVSLNKNSSDKYYKISVTQLEN